MILKAPLAVALETRECGIRSRLADKALQELPEISDRGTSAPKAPTFRSLLEDVHELHRLATLDHRLRGHQRDPDEETDVHQHRPDRCMRNRVEPIETEESIGFQEGDPERPVVDE